MLVIIDGNDGLGKTSLVGALRALGYQVQDRGALTKKTDDHAITLESGAFYVVLDAPIEVSRTRLALAGKDLSERYHTPEDLSFYRNRYLEIASSLPRGALIDASGTKEETLDRALVLLKTAGIRPS